jgi:hypothetical protein
MTSSDLGAAIAAALRSIEALYDLALSPGKATTESQIRVPYASKEPVNLHALDVRHDAVRYVSSWARLVAEERDMEASLTATTAPPPRLRNLWQLGVRTVEQQHELDLLTYRQRTQQLHRIVAWLLQHTTWLADHDAGAEAADELAAVARGLRRHVDRRADDRELVGTCEVCGGDILARPGAAQGHCRKCEVVVDAVAGRERIREELAVRLFTLRELRSAVTFYGWQLSHDRAESWVRRGRLQARGMSARGATYRLDEVLGLLSGEASKRAG